ncbi:MAG: bacteriohemerythrin [Spirochaetaceae bacterium]|nr:bacteriohemerythrin [Spirochaetaceae bacterium]
MIQKKTISKNGSAVLNDMTRIITWDNRYSVEIKKLDDQHKELINAVNELVQYCLADSTEVDEYFLKTIQASSSFAKEHFAAEERLMEAVGFPERKEHERQHAAFAKALLALVKEFEEGRRTVSSDLACFFSAWIIGHIKISDKKYAEYIHSRNISFTA